MGIPHLSQYLAPFAVTKVLGCQTSGCEKHRMRPGVPKNLIIDGPGLAYYVYYKVQGYKSPDWNDLDATPTYTEVGDAFLAFLRELENFGLIM